MSSTLIYFLSALLLAMLVAGIILLCFSKNKKEGKIDAVRFTIGMILVGIPSVAITIFGIYAIFSSGFILIIIFGAPVGIAIGLIMMLAFGINYLVQGYQKDQNGNFDVSKLTKGWVLVGIHIAVIASVIVLMLMLMTGIIPIRLM